MLYVACSKDNIFIYGKKNMDNADKARCKKMIEVNDKLFPCVTSVAMEFIGGKWKSVILIYLIDGKKRYNELKKLIPTITERTLSLQLKKLEKDGLVFRKVYTNKPPLKVEYSLTKFGQTLSPVLKTIAEWGVLAVKEKGKFIEK